MDLSPENVSTLFTYSTDYNADSVEWCPHEPHRNIFVCANYQLSDTQIEGQCERLGRVLLFSISPKSLELHQTINTEAVLDQKWCPNRVGGLSLLAIVTSKGKLEIYKLNEEILLELVTEFHIEAESTETLLLSLDWSTGKYPNEEPHIVCSDSKGNIHEFSLNAKKLILNGDFKGHGFEAWITAFYYWDPNIFFSGGDDSLFLKFDLRSGREAIARNKSHEAGVTSMHSNPTKEYTLATGSYDENVRLWDIRSMKTPQNCIKTPGTLWRLKWDPFYNNFLLAACMLGGVHVIDTKKEKIVNSYYEHKNIAYGADWCHLSKDVTQYSNEGNVIIGTCSFYDNLLCVSKLQCDFQ